MDFSALVCIHEIRHGCNLRIVLVAILGLSVESEQVVVDDLRLGLLTVERVNLTAHEHVGQYEIFEHLNTLRRTCLIIVPEGLKEILASAIPVPLIIRISAELRVFSMILTFTHPHLTTALLYDTHDTWVRNGGTDGV